MAARWDAVSGELTVWDGTQAPISVRGGLASIFQLDEDKVRVIAPDVGGGFGQKVLLFYPDELLVPMAAMQLGRPVKYIEDRIHNEKVSNVKTVLGSPDDPKLPSDSIDAVLLLKVYHEVAHPLVLMANLKLALRSGAKIGIIDRNGNGTDHGLNSDVVKREMAEAGFKLLSSYDFTKADGQDYFLVFVVR